MARSRRKTPVCGNTTAPTDKPFKAISHRQERAAVRSAIAADAEPPHPNAFGDPWKSQKDGKHWFGDRHPEIMRK